MAQKRFEKITMEAEISKEVEEAMPRIERYAEDSTHVLIKLAREGGLTPAEAASALFTVAYSFLEAVLSPEEIEQAMVEWLRDIQEGEDAVEQSAN